LVGVTSGVSDVGERPTGTQQISRVLRAGEPRDGLGASPTSARNRAELVHAVHDYSGTFNITDYRWFNLRDSTSSGPTTLAGPTFSSDGLLYDDYSAKALLRDLPELDRGAREARGLPGRRQAPHRTHRSQHPRRCGGSRGLKSGCRCSDRRHNHGRRLSPPGADDRALLRPGAALARE